MPGSSSWQGWKEPEEDIDGNYIIETTEECDGTSVTDIHSCRYCFKVLTDQNEQDVNNDKIFDNADHDPDAPGAEGFDVKEITDIHNLVEERRKQFVKNIDNFPKDEE